MAGGIGGEKQHASSHLVGGPKFAKGDPQLELPGQTPMVRSSPSRCSPSCHMPYSMGVRVEPGDTRLQRTP